MENLSIFLASHQGSNYEVQTQLVIARELDFAGPELLDKAEALSIEVGRMLSSLISTVAGETKS